MNEYNTATKNMFNFLRKLIILFQAFDSFQLSSSGSSNKETDKTIYSSVQRRKEKQTYIIRLQIHT